MLSLTNKDVDAPLYVVEHINRNSKDTDPGIVSRSWWEKKKNAQNSITTALVIVIIYKFTPKAHTTEFEQEEIVIKENFIINFFWPSYFNWPLDLHLPIYSI